MRLDHPFLWSLKDISRLSKIWNWSFGDETEEIHLKKNTYSKFSNSFPKRINVKANFTDNQYTPGT